MSEKEKEFSGNIRRSIWDLLSIVDGVLILSIDDSGNGRTVETA